MTREFENACQVLYNEPGMAYYSCLSNYPGFGSSSRYKLARAS